MDKIKIVGGNKLYGSIRITGSKNSCLAILASSILCSEPVKLSNIPSVKDVTFMLDLLINLGANLTIDAHNILKEGHDSNAIILHNNLKSTVAEYEFVKKMRASVFTLGPLLGRFGKAKVSLPGGCAIGVRPINLHIMGLEKMGAKIEIEEGYISATAENGLHGAEIEFPLVSVGATENIISAAVLANGITIIKNAATEPEIVHMADFLNHLGARISGHGTSTITIDGVSKLKGNNDAFKIPADRIEAGTYAIAAAVTNGELKLIDCSMNDFLPVLKEFTQIGIGLKEIHNGVLAFKSKEIFDNCDITTNPYPGFTTDLQAQTMIPLILADKKISHVTETIFENRFMHVAELARMGAKIDVSGHTATITGISKLSGATVMATDLRASVSLVIAALAAQGETIVDRIYHLDRGYENLVTKLSMCGAKIQRIS